MSRTREPCVSRLIAVLVAGGVAVAPAFALGAGAVAATTACVVALDDLPAPRVAREDLARAYMRFEQAFADARLEPAAREAFNRGFDDVTSLFFTLNIAGAIERLEELTSDLERRRRPDEPGPEALHRALIVRAEPPVVASGARARLTVGAAFSVALADPRAVDIEIVHEGGAQRISRTLVLAECEPGQLLGDVEIDTHDQPALAGVWSIRVRTGKASAREVGRLTILPSGRLETIRAAIESVIEHAVTEHPEMARAGAVARSRAALLVDRVSRERSAEFMADLPRLADAAEEEARALLRGEDPYRGRSGDWWLEFPGPADSPRSRGLPARVYLPARLAHRQQESGGEGGTAASAPLLPVVVALHGAGGDEQMFMDAYGAGEFKRLAEEKGFLAVSPTSLGLTPGRFASMIDDLAAWYPVDRDRVYVVGHSLGAGVAARLASAAGSRLAAVVLMAGGPMGDRAERDGGQEAGESRPPILMIAGEIDGVFPLKRLSSAASMLRSAGREVEFRVAEGWGHTLVVGAELRGAVEWALARRRGIATP